MNIPESYDYLVRARRDLRATLEGVPDEVLSRPLLDGAKLHCIKDLVFHIANVEDFWIREEILRQPPLYKTIPALKDTRGGPIFDGFALQTLLDYWRVVEQNTLAYLATLTDDELKRIVSVHDRPGKRYSVDGLLWNLIFHEARHVAQISVLLRTQGIAPPFLDLLKYLPVPSA
ncbi:MAG TPA: DinB family protein [Candidatus Acidoferrum sp.]|nr:DinB family protein [Candidatus Acidoferrum sp.]